MQTEEEITQYNMLKAIGLALVMIIMILYAIFNKGEGTAFGIPLDKINQVDSTNQ